MPVRDVRLVVHEGGDNAAKREQRLVYLPGLLFTVALRGGR